MRALCIVADDLTGALDAAAPFAGPQRPVLIPLRPQNLPPAAAVSLTTESRDCDAATAVCRVQATLSALGRQPARLWFKKIDSLLRGHPFAETAAMMRWGGFEDCLFTPAFPQMGRIVRGGRLLRAAPAAAGGGQGPADIVAGLVAAGCAAGPEACEPAGRHRVRVADAATAADLAALAAGHAGYPSKLWAGSGGLARALAGASPLQGCPPVCLVVTGTSHPATRQQVAALAGVAWPAPEDGELCASVARPLLVDPVPDSATADETRGRLRAAMARLRLQDDGALLVIGGDTLSTVLGWSGAAALVCTGEVGPGVPVARIRGGFFHGRRLVSRSGGFGGPDHIRALLAAGGVAG
ncbi:four-carbon acid sugar kinase family protein [Pseudoxanthobacter sp.]|uniref:four-carbon acid sugar kinase family protein n=1 Tax=Pseudoxanthobacter sp. TaxID=1925742 RepID=UPI002FE3D981